MGYEAKVEHELYRLMVDVLKRHNWVVENVSFKGVEPQYRVDSGFADLAVLLVGNRPLLVIECKRKLDISGWRVREDIDPLSPQVIGQALGYAVQCGSPLFATTNGRIFALFVVPGRGERFRLDRHRLLVKDFVLNEENVEEVLSFIAKWKAGVTVPKTSIDWTFILRLRSFVEFLSPHLVSVVKDLLSRSGEFKASFDSFVKKVGDVSIEVFARESAYILMNKIVFYKILERYYGLPKLAKPYNSDGLGYSILLNKQFAEAVSVTKDFEPVFFTGIYDLVYLPSDEYVLGEVGAFIEDMETYRLEEVGSDVVGFIYETLIPETERHQLGQFYTPPQIAELITRWAVRNSGDLVLDPACGSGTFLVKAYKVLKEFKEKSGSKENLHRDILKQVFAFDINPFPAHLTAINLAMRDVEHPTSEMNIIVEDFFNLTPKQRVLSAYTVKTPMGEVRREILIPEVDALVANPPYTRWTEIPDKTRNAITSVIGGLLKQYNLTARVRQGVEPGIYTHFIMWGLRFLKPSGRLGMIISDSWLQTDYGVDFGRFLLDHYKVKALIDISARVFPVPLVGACILLLEKCEDEKERNNNQTVFLYLDVGEIGGFEVNEILNVLERPEEYEEKYLVKVVKQKDIPRDQKWINLIFDTEKILNKLKQKTIPLKELFEPSRGNSFWSIWSMKHGKRPDTGANNFFYLKRDDVEIWDLKEYVIPALISTRYVKFFIFSERDWKELESRGVRCYSFICHRPKDRLPENVLEYIKWGETECKTRASGTSKISGGGKICSQTLACQEREKIRDVFYGWYDLGGVKPVPLISTRYSQYKTRFIWCKFPAMIDEDIITFIPRFNFNETQLKTLLAYLNSSLIQLFMESQGRTTGLGAIALESKLAQDLPVLDVRVLGQKDLESLAFLFDELELEARRLGGADTRENSEKLWDTIIPKIDEEICRILGLPKSLAVQAKQIAKQMMYRRLSRAEEAKPETIRGEEEPKIKPQPKTKPTKKPKPETKSLEEYFK